MKTPPDTGGEIADAASAPEDSAAADRAGLPALDGPAIDGAGDIDLSAPDAPADLAPPPDLAPDAPAKPTMNLVASWTFDQPAAGDVINDGSNRATLHDTTWSGEAAPGMPAGAQSLDFDGKTSWVDLTIANLPRSEAPKTIALWYRSTTATPRLRTLVSLFGSAELANLGIQLGFDGVQFAFWRFGAAGAEGVAPSTLDEWHHGAYTFAANVHRLYVDGRLALTFTGAMRAGALDRARVGTYNPPDELFQGQVNDLRIYDRVLDDAEVAALAHRP